MVIYRDYFPLLENITPRDQTYLLYRFGFQDDVGHPLVGTALHFHPTESWARHTEKEALEHLRQELSAFYCYSENLL